MGETGKRNPNAERQAKLRIRRDREGLCRTCGDPAVMSKRTGRLARQCKEHLKVDRERKEVVPLRWIEPAAAQPNGVPVEMTDGGDLLYPLRWA